MPTPFHPIWSYSSSLHIFLSNHALISNKKKNYIQFLHQVMHLYPQKCKVFLSSINSRRSSHLQPLKKMNSHIHSSTKNHTPPSFQSIMWLLLLIPICVRTCVSISHGKTMIGASWRIMHCCLHRIPNCEPPWLKKKTPPKSGHEPYMQLTVSFFQKTLHVVSS